MQKLSHDCGLRDFPEIQLQLEESGAQMEEIVLEREEDYSMVGAEAAHPEYFIWHPTKKF